VWHNISLYLYNRPVILVRILFSPLKINPIIRRQIAPKITSLKNSVKSDNSKSEYTKIIITTPMAIIIPTPVMNKIINPPIISGKLIINHTIKSAITIEKIII
jgi:hypothetical protein